MWAGVQPPAFPAARLAFSRFGQFRYKLEVLYGNLDDFCKEHDSWLAQYACFQSLKRIESNKAWWEWTDSSKKPNVALLEELKASEEYAFHVFLQYVFWGQWKQLRAYANGKNISLIGDLPIYEAPDSSVVWERPDLFQVDQESAFSHVAGVPPDYFNENGQYWGNPLYDWDRHEEEDYAWWMERLASQLKLFDVLARLRAILQPIKLLPGVWYI